MNSNGEPTAGTYVGAAPPEFDETSMEWACNIEKPSALNYLDSKVVGKIYSIAPNHAFERDTVVADVFGVARSTVYTYLPDRGT